MKTPIKVVPLAVYFLFLVSLGILVPGASAASSDAREIDITGDDTMRYNVTSITAKPGETITVVFTNIGHTPIGVMGHNWILLKAGSDAAAYAQAAVTAQSTNYVPPSLDKEVLAKIDMLGPRKSGEVTFTVPTTPGDYPFLCTFPAHYQVGMHGVLKVK